MPRTQLKPPSRELQALFSSGRPYPSAFSRQMVEIANASEGQSLRNVYCRNDEHEKNKGLARRS